MDGKPGHEKQTLGLCNALARILPVYRLDIPVPGRWKSLIHWITGQFPSGHGLPVPDLLIGAGHATHLPLMAARRAYGGKTVVLMGPSLPLVLFDLCLIPEHDAPPSRPNVVPTMGAINNVIPSNNHDPRRGLILVGGPSSHFQWDSAAITRQIEELVRSKPDIAWTLTTSRRTPAQFLGNLGIDEIEKSSAEATPPGWLEDQLARTGETWVTPDSVSMVYEALTAGCRVGLFELPATARSRVVKGILDLKTKGYVSSFPLLSADTVSEMPPPLNEAARCAKIIASQWHS